MRTGEIVFIFFLRLLLYPPDDVLTKTADLSHFFYFIKKGEIKCNFLNTPSGGLKLSHYFVQNLCFQKFHFVSIVILICVLFLSIVWVYFQQKRILFKKTWFLIG